MVDRQHLNRITYGVENLLDIYLTCKLPEPDWKCVVPGFNDELRSDPLIITAQSEKTAQSLTFTSTHTPGRGRFAPASAFQVVDVTRQPNENKPEATKDYFKTGIDKPDEVHIYSGRKPVSNNTSNSPMDQMLERLNLNSKEPPAVVKKPTTEITDDNKNDPILNNSHHVTAIPITVNTLGNSASTLNPLIESSGNKIPLHSDELKNESTLPPTSSKNNDPVNKQIKTEDHAHAAAIEPIEIKLQENFHQPKVVKTAKPQSTTQKSSTTHASNNKNKPNNKNDGNINSNLNNDEKIHEELDIDEFVPNAVITNNSSNRRHSDLKTNREGSQNADLTNEGKHLSDVSRTKSNSQSTSIVVSELVPKRGAHSNPISTEPKGWKGLENQKIAGTFESIEKDQQAQEDRVKRQARIEAAKMNTSVILTKKVPAPTTWNYVESEPVNLEAIMEEERRNLKKSKASPNKTVVSNNSSHKQGIKSMIPPVVQSKNASSKKGEPFWNIASDVSKHSSNL